MQVSGNENLSASSSEEGNSSSHAGDANYSPDSIYKNEIRFSRMVADYNFHSVLIPKCMWDLENITPTTVENYWRKCSITHATEAISLAELLVTKFLDPSFVSPICDRRMLGLFRIRISGKPDVPVVERYVNLQFCGIRLRNACTKIVDVIGAVHGTPELQQYCDLVKILSKLAPSEEQLIRKMLEKRNGPIKALAENTSIANINWIMSKLKMNVSLPLMHELFGNPTVLGKLNAIWKLLEVHDVLWTGVDWSFVQNAVQQLYSMISWLMEKCAGFAEIISDKFKWVKAKIVKDPDQVVTQAEQDLLTGIEISGVEMSMNDCLYDAIAPQADLSPVQLKDRFIRYLAMLTPDRYAQMLTLEGAEPDSEMSFDEVKRIADSEEMLTDIHAVLIAHCLERNIIIHKEGEFTSRDVYAQRSCSNPIFIRNSHLHFSPAEPSPVTVTTHWLAHEDLFSPIMCECGELAEGQCVFCANPVCLGCWMNCCKEQVQPKHPEHLWGLDEVDKQHPDKKSCGENQIPVEPEVVKARKVAVVNPVTPVVPPPVISPPPITVDTVPSFRDRLWDNWYKICDFFKNLNFSEIGAKITDFLKNLFGNIYTWLKTNPVLVSLMGVFASIASLLGFTLPSITNPLDRRSLVSKLGDATRNLYYVQRTSGNLLETFKGFGDAMADVLGYNTDESIDLFKKRVLEVSESADALLHMAEVNPGKFVNNRKEMRKFELGMQEIDKVYRDLVKISEKANLQAINPIWMKLNKTNQSLKQIRTRWCVNVSERQEPVVLWLYGATNLGKSRLLQKVIDRIRKHYGQDTEVFTLSKGTDHWNGFVGQEIIKFDDFAATRPNGENTDAMAMMNLKTSASFNPSMAAIEEKYIMANPKFILVASNSPSIDLGSGVANIAAFERRRDVFVKVTWPGHEDVCNGISHCQHVKDLAKKAEEDKEETFDHLTLMVADPNVSEVNGRDQTLRESLRGEITLDGIMAQMFELEKMYAKKYELAISNIAMPQDGDSIKNVVFSEYPNVALIGPPGSGKSYIMSAVTNFYKDRSQVIKDDKDLEHLVQVGRADDGKDVVIVDDLSTHLASKSLRGFVDLIKKRSEQISNDTVPWIVGINKRAFDPVLFRLYEAEEIDAQIEIEQMFYRRFQVYSTAFKQTVFARFKRLIGAKQQSPADEVKQRLVEKKVTIDELVEYKKGDKRVTQKTVIDNLCQLKTVVQPVEIEMSMPRKPAQKPDMYMRFDMRTEEFFEVMQKDSLAEVISLLRSEKVLINSGILSKQTLFARIAKSVRSAKEYTGLTFSDFESFFHQASLDGHLNNFSDCIAYLVFKDATYSIESQGDGVAKAFRIDDITNDIMEAKLVLAGAAEAIKTTDFLAFSMSNFSPWFCFVGDLMMTLSKVGLSFLSVSKSMSDQTMFYRSARMVKAVQDGASRFISTEMSSIADRFNSDVITNDKRGNAAYSVNTPQRGIFDSLRGETDKDEKRVPKHAKRQQPRIKREDDSPPTNKRIDRSRDLRRENFGNDKFQSCVTIDNVALEYDEVTARATGKQTKVVTQAVVPVEEFDSLEDVPVYQAVIDNNILPIAEAIVPNFIRIFNSNNKFSCYGLVIRDNIGTTVWHIRQSPQTYYAEDIDGNRYYMEFFNPVVDIDRIDFKLTPIDHSAQRQFRNIVKHIVPRAYSGYAGQQGILMNVTRSKTGRYPVVVMRIYSIVSQVAKWCPDVDKIINLIEYKGYKMGTMITEVMTRDGDCGSVLLVSDPSAPEGRIIGIHSRASKTQAYVRPIFKEDYSQVVPQSSNSMYIGKYMREAVPVADEDHVGKLTIKLHQPETTKIFRNVCPIGEQLYEPSILSPSDTRNPGIDMIGQESEKWLKPPPEISVEDRNLYRKAVGLFSEYYANVLLRNDKKLSVLTKRQAINKYRLSIHSEPIPVQTSPGYPWNQFSKEQGKRDYIAVDEDTGSRRFTKTHNCRKLFDAIDRLEQYCLGKGSAEEPIFQVALKDEPLKLKNIYDKPKTRTIACSPLHFTILMRQYTHSVVACLNDCQDEISCAVGIDPTANDWDFMVRKAITVGKSAIAMDYKGWDFTVHPFEIQCLGDFYVNLMRMCNPEFTEEDAIVIKSLYKILSNPLITYHSKLYRIRQGMMSGQPNTANDNSFINEFRKFFDWVKIMEIQQPHLVGFDHFIKNTYRKFYGDDFFVVVSEFLVPFFNAKTIQKVEEKVFGVTLTSPDKESEIKAAVDVMGITFMSRQFHLLGDRFVGRLEWQRVLKPTHWVHDMRKHKFWESPDEQVRNLEAAFQAFESALLAALPWGKEKYDSIRKPAQQVFSRLGYVQILPDYDTLFNELFEIPPTEEVIYGCNFDHINLTEIQKACGIVRPRIPKWATDFGNRISWHYGPGYSYTGTTHETRPVSNQVGKLLDYVNERYGKQWNSCLFNWYPRQGRIPFHKDDEKELDQEEGVGCLTLYGGGVIGFLHPSEPMYEKILNPGDFYVMNQENLLKYKHSRYDHAVTTLSVTFRKIDSV